jgi:ketosteroid isomerase-like protein
MPAHDQIIEAADRLFATIAGGDVEGVTALWSDEVTVGHQGDERDSDKARVQGDPVVGRRHHLSALRSTSTDRYSTAGLYSSPSCTAPPTAAKRRPCGYAWW